MDFMQRIPQSNEKCDLLPLFTLLDFMFSEKKMKKLMKSIEDSFEYTQISDEIEQIHHTPEKNEASMPIPWWQRLNRRKYCF